MHLAGLSAGKAFIREVARTGQTIGTVHTLGALHLGHWRMTSRLSQCTRTRSSLDHVGATISIWTMILDLLYVRERLP